MGAYCWYVKIPQYGYMEHGLKDIAFYVQKHIALQGVCYNFPLVHDKPLGAPAFGRLVYYIHTENTMADDGLVKQGAWVLATTVSTYRKISNISRTISQNLNDPRLVLQLSLPNLLKPGVKWRMKIAPTGDAPTTTEWSTI